MEAGLSRVSVLATSTARWPEDSGTRCSSNHQVLQFQGSFSSKLDPATYPSLLRKYGNATALWEGKWVHAQILRNGSGTQDYLGNLLMEMYGKCGSLDYAISAFQSIRNRNVFSWTVMIVIYIQQGYEKEALLLFMQMQLEGVDPNGFTYSAVLGACSYPGALSQGKLIHAKVIRCGSVSDVVLETSIVNMYGKCGTVLSGRMLFDAMVERNLVSWNTMIAAYAQSGDDKEALDVFEQMLVEGMKPNKVTYISVLDACSHVNVLEKLYERIVEVGLETDVFVGTSLVNLLGKFGCLYSARSIFDKLSKRDVISWNAMIGAYSQNGHSREALEVFRQMKDEAIRPNWITLIGVLDACTNLADLAEGRQVNDYIIKNDIEDVAIATALINMYAKCGSLEDARVVFENMHRHNVLSWTAMAAAYALHGHGRDAIRILTKMQQEGSSPDGIMFVSVLSACCHAGLVLEPYHFFVSIRDHKIIQMTEHYGCIIKILGLSGLLEEAEDLMLSMPLQNSTMIWTIMLGACQIYGNKEQGKRAADHIIELDPNIDVSYVLLSNIYASNEERENTNYDVSKTALT